MGGAVEDRKDGLRAAKDEIEVEGGDGVGDVWIGARDG